MGFSTVTVRRVVLNRVSYRRAQYGGEPTLVGKLSLLIGQKAFSARLCASQETRATTARHCESKRGNFNSWRVCVVLCVAVVKAFADE